MLNSAKYSYWERKHFFENCDLIVVGAGIVGYSTALHYQAAHPSAKILILERGLLPSGASSKNAGFTCFGSPTELLDDLDHFDEETVWETVIKRMEGLRYLEEIFGKQALSLQVNGSWDLIQSSAPELQHETSKIIPYLNDKMEQICGESAVYSWDGNVSQRFGFEGVMGGFHNRLEGQLDTAQMNAAYYQRVISKGISVLFGVEAIAHSTSSTGISLETSLGEISAGKIAICTNGFAQQFLPNDDILPARAQVLVTRSIPNLSLEGTFHYQKGYYYFRNIDGRVLLGGGRNLDFKGETTTEIATTETIQKELEALLKHVILPNTPFEIEHSWAGVMGVGTTKKPIVKEISKDVYCGVRLGGMGVAIGTLVGKELVDLMK